MAQLDGSQGCSVPLKNMETLGSGDIEHSRRGIHRTREDEFSLLYRRQLQARDCRQVTSVHLDTEPHTCQPRTHT